MTSKEIDFILTIVICLLAVYDGNFTEHRIKKYGLAVEMNRLITWLVPKLGIEVTIGLVVMIPTLTLCSFAVTYNLTYLLGFLLGARAVTAHNQWISLRLEPEIDKAILAQRTRDLAMASTSKPLDD